MVTKLQRKELRWPLSMERNDGRGWIVYRVPLLTLKHKARQNPCSEELITTLQLSLKMKWDLTVSLSLSLMQ